MRKHPFFVVAGLAGDCQKPKQMFCIPLKEAKWQELYPSVFMKFERRPPDKQFFWRNGVLS